MTRPSDDTLLQLGFSPFKEIAVTWAKQMEAEFDCEALNGDQTRGNPGDYLCIGANGETWPIAKDIFEQKYMRNE